MFPNFHSKICKGICFRSHAMGVSFKSNVWYRAKEEKILVVVGIICDQWISTKYRDVISRCRPKQRVVVLYFIGMPSAYRKLKKA